MRRRTTVGKHLVGNGQPAPDNSLGCFGQTVPKDFGYNVSIH